MRVYVCASLGVAVRPCPGGWVNGLVSDRMNVRGRRLSSGPGSGIGKAFGQGEMPTSLARGVSAYLLGGLTTMSLMISDEYTEYTVCGRGWR